MVSAAVAAKSSTGIMATGMAPMMALRAGFTIDANGFIIPMGRIPRIALSRGPSFVSPQKTDDIGDTHHQN